MKVTANDWLETLNLIAETINFEACGFGFIAEEKAIVGALLDSRIPLLFTTNIDVDSLVRHYLVGHRQLEGKPDLLVFAREFMMVEMPDDQSAFYEGILSRDAQLYRQILGYVSAAQAEGGTSKP